MVRAFFYYFCCITRCAQIISSLLFALCFVLGIEIPSAKGESREKHLINNLVYFTAGSLAFILFPIIREILR